MNYDQIAKAGIDMLRRHCRFIRKDYNRVTGEKITPHIISISPKSRLLYMACRFEAESDVSRRRPEELGFTKVELTPGTWIVKVGD